MIVISTITRKFHRSAYRQLPQSHEQTMITGMHGMFYSSQPEELRIFLRDTLGLPAVDVGDGWLIMTPPDADLGVHPTEGEDVPSGTASISFWCENIHTTVAELQSRGVVFTSDVEDHGYGLVTYMAAPGDFTIQLYQPRYSK
ncbi:MAG TPA: extradiol dioxygenase [Bacteroidetes bacterium]|nr:extradiol dioxygenase [Bacteroidota bacterium]